MSHLSRRVYDNIWCMIIRLVYNGLVIICSRLVMNLVSRLTRITIRGTTIIQAEFWVLSFEFHPLIFSQFLKYSSNEKESSDFPHIWRNIKWLDILDYTISSLWKLDFALEVSLKLHIYCVLNLRVAAEWLSPHFLSKLHQSLHSAHIMILPFSPQSEMNYSDPS